MILKLGEAGAIRLLVSPQVLEEIEGALRRKAPELLSLLALLLDRSGVEVTPAPSPQVVQDSLALTGHAGDAHEQKHAQESQRQDDDGHGQCSVAIRACPPDDPIRFVRASRSPVA